jgi:O-antigen ligase
MRFIADRLRAIGRPFARAGRWALGKVPKMPRTGGRTLERASYNWGFLRTFSAPRWRKLVRWTVVAAGFSLYILMQIILAYFCNQLMWPYIVAVMITIGCLIFAAARPTATFIFWFSFSPLGFLFLRMDFGESLPAITFDRVALMALAGFLLLRTLVERHRIKKPLVGELMAVTLICYASAALYIMQPDSLQHTLSTISEKFDHVALALVAYYIAKSVLVTRKNLISALIGLMITGLYVTLSAYYEHFTGNMWFSSFMPSQYHLAYDDVGRACGPLFNPAAMGTFLGITAFLSFHFAGTTESRSARTFFYVATAMQLVGCYFCFTRSGYMSAILLFVAMPFFAKSTRKNYIALVVVAAVIGMVAVPLIASNTAIERRMTGSITIYYRLAVTYATINIIKHHPLFGVGLGEIDHGIEKYITNVGTLSGLYARGRPPSTFYADNKLVNTVTSHNSILTVCAEEGLIGGFLYVGALVALLLHLIKLRARLPDKGVLGKDFIAFLVLACIGHIISIMGYDVRFFKYPNYFLWVLLAIGVRLGEIVAEEARSRAAEEAGVPEQIVPALVHA